MKDTYYWLTTGTKTFDDQDKLNSFKSFPDKEYIPHILDCLEYESTLFLEKSRTMMASWTVSGWCAHKGFNSPFTTVFQSQDEDRAVHDVENVKTLWSQSEPELQARWPLAKPMDKQPYNFLEMANGSWFIGIPGDPNKVRSEHPSCYVADEAAFMVDGEDAYGNAQGTRAPHVICLSSANPGWFYGMTKDAKLIDWPKYARVLA